MFRVEDGLGGVDLPHEEIPLVRSQRFSVHIRTQALSGPKVPCNGPRRPRPALDPQKGGSFHATPSPNTAGYRGSLIRNRIPLGPYAQPVRMTVNVSHCAGASSSSRGSSSDRLCGGSSSERACGTPRAALAFGGARSGDPGSAFPCSYSAGREELY